MIFSRRNTGSYLRIEGTAHSDSHGLSLLSQTRVALLERKLPVRGLALFAYVSSIRFRPFCLVGA